MARKYSPMWAWTWRAPSSSGRRRGAAPDQIVTCAAIHAVHLEALQSLDTLSILMAMARLAARRGRPKRVVTDNATSYVAADRDLRQAMEEFQAGALREAEPGITWLFQPPQTPHAGGFFERLIQSMKKAMVTAMDRPEKLTFMEFVTSLTAVKDLLNSRPIGMVSADAEDGVLLTPNSFLGAPLAGHLGPGTLEEWAIGKRWATLQRRLADLTKTFRNEIIAQLHQEDIWVQRDMTPTVGQICAVLEYQRAGKRPKMRKMGI